MKHDLGTLQVLVTLDDNGDVDVSHQTALAPGLEEMLGALSEKDKLYATQLRRAACKAAADFFLFIRDPDSNLEAF